MRKNKVVKGFINQPRTAVTLVMAGSIGNLGCSQAKGKGKEMEYSSHRHPMVDYLLIIVGTTLLALAINSFFDPLELVTGGVTGFSIVLKELTKNVIVGGIPIYITNIVVNVPLFIVALVIRGKDFGVRSLFATFYLSFALYYTEFAPAATNNILLGSVFGGALAGIGLGLVFGAFATTGGTDLLASIIQYFLKHISVARIMLGVDAVIIALGVYVFGVEKGMYAIIAVYISVHVIDSILEGISFSKAAFIISEHNQEIAAKLLEVLDRGVTGLFGRGHYTKQEKEVLLCVVSKREIVRLKEIVKDYDEKAFVIVADVREVLGEGFSEYSNVKKKR